MAKVIVIGAGTIGQRLIIELLSKGVEIAAVVTRHQQENALSGWVPASDFMQLVDNVKHYGVDAVFLTTPSNDHGAAARGYALPFLGQGIPVITAEKGTSAYHFETFAPFVGAGLFGGYATVGGGMLLIPKMQLHRLRGRKLNIHGVFNATLNYIMTGVAEGRALITVCEEAVDLHYAEPAIKIDPVSIVNGEINDVRLKICAFFNQVLAPIGGPYLRPDQFADVSPVDWGDLQRYTDYNRRCRYIVRITNDGSNHHGHGGRGWLHAKLGQWDFDARFVDLSKGTPLDDFLPNGVDNCVKVQDVESGNGPYREMGPGAGKIPTVDALITNFEAILEKRAAQKQLAA